MKLTEKRAEYLEQVPRWYSGWVHLGLINLSGLAVIGVCLWQVDAPSWPQIALVPAFFVFANFFEWWVHRGPLHRRTRGLALLYDRHTRIHHVVFDGDRMEIERPRELLFVLFPPYVMPILILITSPVTIGLWFLHPNLAWLFLASAIAYYLVYEWLHLCHHLPGDGFIGRRAIVRLLRRHHWRHHEHEHMLDGNFNVSFPLADWILGSRLPPGSTREESTAARR